MDHLKIITENECKETIAFDLQLGINILVI
jgi:hypothetical protein